MVTADIINDLSNKIMELYKISPAAGAEKNLNALLQGAFTKLELVSREEFDVQADLLRVSREKLELFENKLKKLELMLQENNK